MKLTNNLYFYPEQGMFDCNTYVVAGSPGIVIDPGNPMFLGGLAEAMRRDGLDPAGIGLIVNTHLHGDHCGANEAFKELSGAGITLHPVQKEFYGVSVIDVARLFGMPPPEFREDACTEGDVLRAGGTELGLIPAPGHSPDSVCFYHAGDKALICGDVLFAGNTGRVDLPGGNAEELKQSIEALAPLAVEHLLPGHMDTVSGAERVRANFDFIRENVLKWL